MNCPMCYTGVLQLAGEMYLKTDEVNQFPPKFELTKLETNFKLNIFVCSKHICNFTTFEVDKQFLPFVEKIKKEQYLKELKAN